MGSVTFANHIVASRDGKRGLLLPRAEGPAPLPDATGFAFNTVLPSKDRGPRVVVHVTGSAEASYEPKNLGVPPSGDARFDWYMVAEAAVGDWLDQLDTPGENIECESPVRITLTSQAAESFLNRPRADDSTILSFAAAKMYWTWRFELDNTMFDGSDCLRLRTTLRTIGKMLTLEEGTLWTNSGSTPTSVLFRPTPLLLRTQREKRMLTAPGAGMSAAEAALKAPRYAGVRAHLSKAHAFLGQDPPDLANSAKEAVCAVEALARLVCGDSTATLGDLIKVLKNKQGLDPALVKALEGIWGYTSNAPAVRHGGVAELDIVQAQVTLDLARSSINYLLRADTT